MLEENLLQLAPMHGYSEVSPTVLNRTSAQIIIKKSWALVSHRTYMNDKTKLKFRVRKKLTQHPAIENTMVTWEFQKYACLFFRCSLNKVSCRLWQILCCPSEIHHLLLEAKKWVVSIISKGNWVIGLWFMRVLTLRREVPSQVG